MLLKYYLCCFEQRGHLSERSIILFSLDIEEGVLPGRIFSHADTEHQLVVVHLFGHVVEVAVVRGKRDRLQLRCYLHCRQLALLANESLWTLTPEGSVCRTTPSVAAVADDRFHLCTEEAKEKCGKD